MVKIITQKMDILKLLIFSFILILASILTIYFGLSNKIGYVKAYNFLLSANITYMIDSLLTRASTYEETLLIMLYSKTVDIDFQYEMLYNYMSVLLSRLHFIIPFIDFNPESYKYSFNSVSFKLLFSPTEVIKLTHAGSTPGVFASMFFLPIPLGFIYEILILIIIIRGFNNLFKGIKLNIVGIVLLSFFFSRVIENTLNILYIVDPSLFLFLSFICFAFCIDTSQKSI